MPKVAGRFSIKLASALRQLKKHKTLNVQLKVGDKVVNRRFKYMVEATEEYRKFYESIGKWAPIVSQKGKQLVDKLKEADIEVYVESNAPKALKVLLTLGIIASVYYGCVKSGFTISSLVALLIRYGLPTQATVGLLGLATMIIGFAILLSITSLFSRKVLVFVGGYSSNITYCKHEVPVVSRGHVKYLILYPASMEKEWNENLATRLIPKLASLAMAIENNLDAAYGWDIVSSLLTAADAKGQMYKEVITLADNALKEATEIVRMLSHRTASELKRITVSRTPIEIVRETEKPSQNTEQSTTVPVRVVEVKSKVRIDSRTVAALLLLLLGLMILFM